VVIAKPVVVTTTTNTTTTGTSDLPPPPPPPPSGKPKSNWGRKLFIYLTLGTLVFYPTSALISTHSDRYRDFFTSSFPLAETLVDYADENNWDELTPGSIVTGAQGLGNKVAGTTVPPETQKTSVEKTAQRTAERTKEAVKETGKSWSDKIDAAQTKASQKLESARSAISSSTDRAEKKTVDEAAELKREAKVAAAKTSSSAAKAAENIKAEAKHVVEVVKEKTAAAVEKLPTMPQFSEGVTDLASKAEAALEGAEKKAEGALVKAEKKAEGALAKAENKIEATEKKVEAVAKEAVRNKGGPVVDPAVQAQLVDTQRPRDVKANTAPKAALVEEKKPWTGAPLPLGFEPPAGYYIPKPEKKKDSHGVPIDPIVAADPKTEGTPVVKHNLPLLAPRVAEFTSAKEEPIIAQLASTIDSLASSLSATSSAATSLTSDSNPEHVLSRAQTDLSSLSQRLQALKDEEKAKLQKIAEQKKNEFETELKTKEKAWENKEGEMMNGWKEEREKLVEGWRKVLDRELEGQRVGIEQR
jgi:mitofilin